MGCKLTKDEEKISEEQEDKMPKEFDSKLDYKSRFERKMCLAKETPEPIFDLSDCNLKEVPSGVYVLCRVLRKEILSLNNNKLTTIDNGGFLNELSLLEILDVRFNKIKQLPDDIFKLENLRELLISNNQLVKLPNKINTLKYLELLDLSNNNIENIDEINCMPRLKILNLSGNKNLKHLPKLLATCDNLNDLIVDIETIEWPPSEVILGGTENVLKFLTTGESTIADLNLPEFGEEAINVNLYKSNEDILIRELEEREARRRNIGYRKFVDCDGYGNENALIEQLHLKQQKQKQELLEAVLLQQNETEQLVNVVQQQKDNERGKLIKDIIKAEENANIVIENLLALKTNPDPVLLEQERIEEERLLEKLHLEHSDLRKHEILITMLETLQDEEIKVQEYQQKKFASSHEILERELETNIHLGEFFRTYEKNRNVIIEKICEDEELQKLAVATLIEKNDARTWGLVEQLKIVETQLAGMTLLEIEKKKYSTVEQMAELTDKRLQLTWILTDLLEQQESRRKQLFDTLLSIEAQKSNEQEDFWLLQYQRLLDSRPLEFSSKTKYLDSLLGFNFLVNGVIHCLPFFQKLWQNNDICLENITNDDLKQAGIRDEHDRKLILKSIIDYLKDNNDSCGAVALPSPSAPSVSPVSPAEIAREIPYDNNGIEGMSECVICMEVTVKVIFLPCGHLCCCLGCQDKVDICPMCRGIIERKIKIIQP